MDDLIRRAEAIEVIQKMMEVYWDRKVILAMVWDQIKDLPSAQPKTQLSTEDTTFDCISRQAALAMIEEYFNGLPIAVHYDMLAMIHRLPSAQPEQQWIPCSERLPEDYTDVLVYFEYFRYGDYNCLYQTHGIGSYSTEYDSWMINHETGWRKLRVIAWMPLPEPYKGEHE